MHASVVSDGRRLVKRTYLGTTSILNPIRLNNNRSAAHRLGEAKGLR
jgi:hypothetical protein